MEKQVLTALSNMTRQASCLCSHTDVHREVQHLGDNESKFSGDNRWHICWWMHCWDLPIFGGSQHMM